MLGTIAPCADPAQCLLAVANSAMPGRLAFGVILLLVVPELLVAKRGIAGGGATPEPAAGDGFGFRQVGRVIGLEVALEVGFNFEALAVCAVVGVESNLLRGRAIGRVVGLFDLGVLLAGCALLGFVAEIIAP